MALAGLPTLLSAQQRPVPFAPGMVITASTRIAPGSYRIPGGDSVGIVIRGSNIVVDLRGVELVGDSLRTRPDRFTRTGLIVDGGRDVTVRGITIRGVKHGIIARGTRNLRLLDNTLSHNHKPRLLSGIEKESLVDWMSFHQNEKGEWLRFGAGIYLDAVTGGEIKGNTVRQGANGLMMTRTDSVLVWNNDFSFNSALGIGMYRSSHNRIVHNRIDWNVRGYSHGFYHRGQDSAGLLMYEQSSHNVVAHNSVTHSGDGLFLWAGQHTMDTGDGGANDNLFYGNDFSHAPTNGIEATFSRNVFVRNRIEENWHGVWGGYSYQSVFLGNSFRNNFEAIAIEHGQDNRIAGNTFEGDNTAIRLWWNRLEPSDWGYPKYRDTRSRDYVVLGNSFFDVRLAFRVDNTQRLRVDGNVFRGVDSLTRLTGDTTGWTLVPATGGRQAPSPVPARYLVPKRSGGLDAMIPDGARRGKATIIVDKWGPYDWQSPKLWPVGRSDQSPQPLRVLGPPGVWRVVGLEGVMALSAEAGTVGDTLTVVPTGGREHDWSVELEYTGAPVVSPFGEVTGKGEPVRFGWSRFAPKIAWQLQFRPAPAVTLDSTTQVVARMDTTHLDLTWYRPPRTGIPQAGVHTTARGVVKLAPGRYMLRTVADDAVWVFLDGVMILEDSVPGESRVREVEFTATGTHELRVEHWQKDGWYELRVDVDKTEGQR
ncbi:MAG: NosD domain-containing protein [Gemmatimonadales bacterium]|nr:NosD domain-containing protein [Gemmatimonadales bacterium]